MTLPVPRLSGVPDRDVAVPAVVRSVARGRSVTPVWRNGLGGLTFRIGGTAGAAQDVEYVKTLPTGSAGGLVAEAERLAWAGRWFAVPEVLGRGEDDGTGWLHTRGLPGRNAIDPRWIDDPRTSAIAVGEALRALHDTLPVDDCPFTWSAAGRIAAAGVSPARVAALGPEPPTDRLVVCHGDACTPNTLIGDDGRWSGVVDLDALGVADRWADLAVATMSFGWNHGPGWTDVVLDAYGIGRDDERSAWYRRLWLLDDGPDDEPGHRPAGASDDDEPGDGEPDDDGATARA